MALQTNLRTLEPLGHAKLDRLFAACVDDVAINLVGMYIASENDGLLVGGQIVETEAYCENDPAAHCHAAARPPRRQKQGKAMQNSAGHIYVYPSSVYNNYGHVVSKPYVWLIRSWECCSPTRVVAHRG